jgi:DNA-binding MltR family transcriptional regulator
MAIDWVRIFSTVSKGMRTRRTLAWKGTSIKDHLTPDDWKSFYVEFREQFYKRNDRAFAITCASMIEERLRWLIETKFISDLSISKRKWIFRGAGPLATFVGKVEVAFALGLIQDHLRRELLLIGRIRNKFAHSFRKVRFSNLEIAKLCDRLREFDKDMPKENDPMKLYGQSCFLSMMVLFMSARAVPGSTQPSASRGKSRSRPLPQSPNRT